MGHLDTKTIQTHLSGIHLWHVYLSYWANKLMWSVKSFGKSCRGLSIQTVQFILLVNISGDWAILILVYIAQCHLSMNSFAFSTVEASCLTSGRFQRLAFPQVFVCYAEVVLSAVVVRARLWKGRQLSLQWQWLPLASRILGQLSSTSSASHRSTTQCKPTWFYVFVYEVPDYLITYSENFPTKLGAILNQARTSSLTLSLSLSLSLSHTHTHTHTHSLSHTHTYTRARSSTHTHARTRHTQTYDADDEKTEGREVESLNVRTSIWRLGSHFKKAEIFWSQFRYILVTCYKSAICSTTMFGSVCLVVGIFQNLIKRGWKR